MLYPPYRHSIVGFSVPYLNFLEMFYHNRDLTLILESLFHPIFFACHETWHHNLRVVAFRNQVVINVVGMIRVAICC